ncbi:PadR family transcriptional regulator [Candidatus Woesearchaeota archaeon]|nr:PadR family transcriptional regulator [Candidatus Woesearchaeota archaeon]
MRSHLKSLILKMLNDKAMSGSEIITEINNLMNWKPSCGSIYPLLNSLETDGLTISNLNQGKKIYSLTAKAKKLVKEKYDEKEELIVAMEKSYKLLESIYGFDTSMEREMLKDIKKGSMPFHEIYDESMFLKEELARIQKKNLLSKNIVEIKNILRKAGNDLKKIR